MSAKKRSNTIDLTRIYDAPVKMVWEAFTEPKHVAHWWGPRGFTLTTHSKDIRTGGHWNYTMHGPDGVDWENRTKYLEVEKYSRLVYDHGANETQPPLFRVTATFTALNNGQTRMDMSMALATPEAADETRKFVKKAGGNSTWDRLAEYLEKEKTGKETFVINRSFDAPIETIFEMWTNPNHFSKWLAPTGFHMEFIDAQIRPGGVSFYKMISDDGKVEMYGKVRYQEITRPTHLLYTQEFTDKQGNLSRHPMAPTWPALMQTNVSFTSEGPDQTRITVSWEVVGSYTSEELATFIEGRAGMTQGWTGSFDKLEDYLVAL